MPRPRRTRVYGANYDIGESLYRPALDRLDRKYSGRPLDTVSEPPAASTPIRDLSERFDRAFEDEDLSTSRRRAEKHIVEDNAFDVGGSIAQRMSTAGRNAAIDAFESELDDEIAGKLRRIRANRKLVNTLDDVDLEGTVSSLTSKRTIGMSEKMLDSVGINDTTIKRIQQNSDAAFKRRSMNIEEEIESAAPAIIGKWSAVKDRSDEETGISATLRAKQSRARLQDLADEMEAINERQAVRERRSAQMRALVAENEENNASMAQSAMKSVRMSARAEKKTVTF